MRKTLWIGIVVLAGSVLSCKETKVEGMEMKSDYRNTGASEFDEKDFSDWMSKADQQMVYEARKEGHYFAFTEGRDNGGLLEFRHVLKKFPSDKYAEWGVFWGLSSEEFYQVDLKMLRAGFKRETLQVFTDAAGRAYHQGLWILPKARE